MRLAESSLAREHGLPVGMGGLNSVCAYKTFIIREEPHRKGHLLLDLFLSKHGKILQRTMVKLGKQLVEQQVPFLLVTDTFQHMIHLKGHRHGHLTLLQHTGTMA